MQAALETLASCEHGLKPEWRQLGGSAEARVPFPSQRARQLCRGQSKRGLTCAAVGGNVAHEVAPIEVHALDRPCDLHCRAAPLPIVAPLSTRTLVTGD